jgi:D-xylose transport system ATP-binding protein
VDFDVDVANLYLGSELVEPGVRRLRRSLDETAMERRTRELLSSLSVTTLDSPRTQVGSLSGGQRQAVAIARSLVAQPREDVVAAITGALPEAVAA